MAQGREELAASTVLVARQIWRSALGAVHESGGVEGGRISGCLYKDGAVHHFPAIVIDTREQLPYGFDGHSTIRGALKYGDYSLAGFESDVAVERKSHADAYGCIGRDRARFRRCLEGLAMLSRPLLVIEPGLAEFVQPPSRTRITTAQAVGSYLSWACQYRIPTVWAGSRAYGERLALRWLVAFWKHRVLSGESRC